MLNNRYSLLCDADERRHSVCEFLIYGYQILYSYNTILIIGEVIYNKMYIYWKQVATVLKLNDQFRREMLQRVAEAELN